MADQRTIDRATGSCLGCLVGTLFWGSVIIYFWFCSPKPKSDPLPSVTPSTLEVKKDTP